MRFATILVIGATVGFSAGRPRGHGHHHVHHHKERGPDAEPQAIDTVYSYVLNGQPISSEEVQEGIRNGTLQIAGGALMNAASTSVTNVQPSPTPTPAPQAQASSLGPAPASASATTDESSSDKGNYGTNSPAGSASQAPDAPSAPTDANVEGLDSDFPDGTIDCSQFPSQHGAISLEYLGLGGWSGIQCPEEKLSAGFNKISTKTMGQSCSEGDFCSYACPAGYQKTQWPTTQGATGQSIGGLQCKGGKLFLTNPSLSRKLCAQGSTAVKINVKNTMSKGTAICRTDYPGTEGETIPVDAKPGTTSDLTCPDAKDYYTWGNKPTSAQYYVNPKGTSTQDGCQWDSAGSNEGNYAPLNLGVGYKDGAAWLGIFQNSPTTNAKLDFKVEVVGDDLTAGCKYEHGKYISLDKSGSVISANDNGCTTSASSGTVTFVLSD